MGIIKGGILGAALPAGTVGPRKVSAVPTTREVSPPIEVAKLVRNGKHPGASFWNQLNEATNEATLWRTKEVWSQLGRTQQPISSFGAGSRARFRSAFWTGPYTHSLCAVVVMMPPTSGYDQNTYGKLTIYSDTAEATSVATQTFTYGVSPTGSSTASGFPYWKTIIKYVEGLLPNTAYYLKFSDENYGRIHSACVFDLQSLTEEFDGYLSQNLTAETPIFDTYRSAVAAMQKDLWKRGAAKVFTWSVDDGTNPVAIAGATPVNVLDQTSTTYGDSIPGFTIDMRNKDRLSQTSGVPVAFKAHISSNSTNNGSVQLRDSAGTALCTLNYADIAGTRRWYAGTATLPAALSKYYLTASTALGTVSVYAASCYEYET